MSSRSELLKCKSRAYQYSQAITREMTMIQYRLIELRKQLEDAQKVYRESDIALSESEVKLVKPVRAIKRRISTTRISKSMAIKMLEQLAREAKL